MLTGMIKFTSAAKALLLCLLLACTNLRAQSTAQIQGVVQDQSGSAVPGAEIRAIQTETGAVRVVASDANGAYVLANLPVGPYRLEGSKPGFATYVQTGIVLQVASTPTVDVPLKVGEVSDQVRVEANAAMVDTERMGIGSVIENQRIQELPLNGRNVFSLIQLAGASVPGPVGSAGASIPGAQTISVAGGQIYGMAYWLDGTPFNNPYDATQLPFPFPDALQEFKVETSALTAQNGVHSGAAVNAVTKSGTNEYHGDAFEFLRNGDLNARNFFAAKRDSLKRNQFGGVIGGPVMRNKLFFFAGYEGTIVRQDASGSTAFVPTAQMLNGNFTAFTSPACNSGRQVNLPAPFSGNVVAVSLLSKSALSAASHLPLSNDPCGRVLFGPRTVFNEHQGVGRVDYQLNDKHTLFGRYVGTSYVQPAPVSLPGASVLDATGGGHDQLATSFTLGETWLISSTMVNSFRASFDRTGSHTLGGAFFSGCDIGVNMYCYVPHETTLSVTGGFTVGGPLAVDAILSPTTYQLGDDLTLVRGKHQFGFGWNQYQYRSTTVGGVYSQGTFAFTGVATGNGMADFLLGSLGSLQQGGPNILETRKNYVGTYAQDTWKLTPRLTINLGVRWEPFIPQQMTNGAVYNFSLSRFQQNLKSTVFANAPAGLTFPGDTGFASNAGMNRQWNLLAPRVGIAWDPTGSGKTSIRASYGLAYDFINAQFFATTSLAPPWGDLVRVTGPVSFENPWATTPGGNIFPIAFNKNAPFVNFGTFLAIDPNEKATSVHSWSFAIQRQIGTAWLVSATYAGSEAQHVWQTVQINPAVIVPSSSPLGTCPAGTTTGCNSTTNTNQRRTLYLQNPAQGQLIGFMDQITDGGTGSYNGLILAVQRRLSHGLSASANYTWSHCIGYASIGATPVGTGTGYVNPSNRAFDRGNCGTDRRQIANITLVAQTPRFSNNILRIAGTGWKAAGIFTTTSGAWLTATSPTDQALTGQTNERASQINPNPLCANPGINCWINPASFALPALGTLGNLSPANIRGPGFFNLDMALSREFRIREKKSLEIRGEAFNFTNSFRPGGVTTSLSANFGKILTATDPRILQVAMKVTF
jgi:hypothetical protein